MADTDWASELRAYKESAASTATIDWKAELDTYRAREEEPTPTSVGRRVLKYAHRAFDWYPIADAFKLGGTALLKKAEEKMEGPRLQYFTPGDENDPVQGYSYSAPQDPAEYEKFKQWYDETVPSLSPPSDPRHQYDYYAAFKAGELPDESGHWPSRFKAPTHPNRFVKIEDPEGDATIIDSITSQPVLPGRKKGEYAVLASGPLNAPKLGVEGLWRGSAGLLESAGNTLQALTYRRPTRMDPITHRHPWLKQYQPAAGKRRTSMYDIGTEARTAEQREAAMEEYRAIGKKLASYGIKLREAAPERPEELQKDWKELLADPRTRWPYLFTAIGENAPNLLAAAGVSAAAAVTGGAAAGAVAGFGTAFVLETGFSFKELREMGADPEMASQIASNVGIANGILEFAPIARLFSKNPAFKKLFFRKMAKEAVENPTFLAALRRASEQAVTEGATEGLQEIVSNIGKLFFDENQKLLEGVGESAFIGLLLGGGTSSTIDAFDAAIEEIKKGKNPQELDPSPPVGSPFEPHFRALLPEGEQRLLIPERSVVPDWTTGTGEIQPGYPGTAPSRISGESAGPVQAPRPAPAPSLLPQGTAAPEPAAPPSSPPIPTTPPVRADTRVLERARERNLEDKTNQALLKRVGITRAAAPAPAVEPKAEARPRPPKEEPRPLMPTITPPDRLGVISAPRPEPPPIERELPSPTNEWVGRLLEDPEPAKVLTAVVKTTPSGEHTQLGYDLGGLAFVDPRMGDVLQESMDLLEMELDGLDLTDISQADQNMLLGMAHQALREGSELRMALEDANSISEEDLRSKYSVSKKVVDDAAERIANDGSVNIDLLISNLQRYYQSLKQEVHNDPDISPAEVKEVEDAADAAEVPEPESGVRGQIYEATQKVKEETGLSWVAPAKILEESGVSLEELKTFVREGAASGAVSVSVGDQTTWTDEERRVNEAIGEIGGRIQGLIKIAEPPPKGMTFFQARRAQYPDRMGETTIDKERLGRGLGQRRGTETTLESPYEFGPQQIHATRALHAFALQALREMGASPEVLQKIDIAFKPVLNISQNADPRVLEHYRKRGINLNPDDVLGKVTINDWGALIQLATNLQNLSGIKSALAEEWAHIAVEKLSSAEDYRKLMKFYKGDPEAAAQDGMKFFLKGDSYGMGKPNWLRRMWLNTRAFVQRLGNWMRQRGYYRPEDFFGRIKTGDYRSRFANTRPVSSTGPRTFAGEEFIPEGPIPTSFAMVAGPLSRGHNGTALARAHTMFSAGVPMETITAQTGWSLGMDDFWRHEISDHEAQLKYDSQTLIRENGGVKLTSNDRLGTILHHPRLFGNYPFLKQARVNFTIDPAADEVISFVGRLWQGAAPEIVVIAPNPTEGLAKLLHETQHLIQLYEGFAIGMHPEGATIREQIMDMAAQDITSANPEFGNLHQMAKDGLLEDEEYGDYLRILDDFIESKYASYQPLAAMDLHLRSAGEIEAGDVEARMELNEEQRRRVKLYSSSGIPREEVVLRFDEEFRGKQYLAAQNRRKVEPWYYSQASRAVGVGVGALEGKGKGGMPGKAQSLPSWLQKQGITKEELDWLDVGEWLKENTDEKGKFDRNAFYDYVKANELVIQEILRGAEWRNVRTIADKVEAKEKKELEDRIPADTQLYIPDGVDTDYIYAGVAERVASMGYPIVIADKTLGNGDRILELTDTNAFYRIEKTPDGYQLIRDSTMERSHPRVVNFITFSEAYAKAIEDIYTNSNMGYITALPNMSREQRINTFRRMVWSHAGAIDGVSEFQVEVLDQLKELYPESYYVEEGRDILDAMQAEDVVDLLTHYERGLDWSEDQAREWVDAWEKRGGDLNDPEIQDVLADIGYNSPHIRDQWSIFDVLDNLETMHADNMVKIGNILLGENATEAILSGLQLQGADVQSLRMGNVADAELDFLDDEGLETEYSDYSLKGGRNYREITFHLPKDESSRYGTYIMPHFSGSPQTTFAHMRVSDRVAPDGAAVLFVEEFQSDWLQTAKKEGWGQTEDLRKIREGPEYAPFGPLRSGEGVGAWPTLLLKRAMRYAAENGYDRLAWTTGRQQVDRYGSAIGAHIDKIQWSIDTLQEGGPPVLMVHGQQGMVSKYSGNYHYNEETGKWEVSDAYSGYRYTPTPPGTPLNSVVGDEFASRISNSIAEGKTNDSYTDLDMIIGGKGMVAFYDELLPGRAKKLVKKFGSKVYKEQTPVGMNLEEILRVIYGAELTAIKLGYEDVAGHIEERAKHQFKDQPNYMAVAQAYADSVRAGGSLAENNRAAMEAGVKNGVIETEPVWAFDITPKMTDHVLFEGQTYFSVIHNLASKGSPKVRDKIAQLYKDSMEPVEGSVLDRGASDYLNAEDPTNLDPYLRSLPDIGDLTPTELAQIVEDITTYRTRGGKEKPAIRLSGFHALEKFKQGIEGYKDIGKSEKWLADPSRLAQAIDQGHFGGAVQKYILWPLRRNTLAKMKYNDGRKAEVAAIQEKYNIKSGKKARIVGDIIEHISAKDAWQTPVRDLRNVPGIRDALKDYPSSETQYDIVMAAISYRKLFEKLLRDQNKARKQRNQSLIPHREFYRSWLLDRSLIGRFSNAMKGISDIMSPKAEMPDFIQPNQPFNPRALPRGKKLENLRKERNITKIMLEYIETAGKDIFDTNVIHNTKVHTAVMKGEGLELAADALDSYVGEVFGGVKPRGQKAAEETPFAVLLPAAYWTRRQLTRAVFPLNFSWNMFVQTSSAGLTVARYGIRSSLAGLSYFTDPATNIAVRQNAYSQIIKSRWGGKSHYQDIQSSLVKNKRLEASPIEKVEDALNFLTSAVESGLTGHAVAAAHHYGKTVLGLKGRALWEYASEGGSKTQSMYNFGDLPGALRQKWLTSLVPFTTYAFEAMNTVREMNYPVLNRVIGKTGTYETLSADSVEGKALLSKRAKMLMRFTAAIMLTNAIGEGAIGRKPWMPSSFVPFLAQMLMGFGTFTNIGTLREWLGVESRGPHKPMFPLTDYPVALIKGIQQLFQYGSWSGLRKWATRYHTTGGVQINRTIEGLIATSQGGDVKNVEGKTMFTIPESEYPQAVIGGPWQTTPGREYLQKKKPKVTLKQFMLGESGKAKSGGNAYSRYK